MMTNKKYILIGLLTLGISACNTDDLERDINALKERVENYEAQVQRLNDDMNIIRVLLDGNKSISGYTVEGDTYVLTLSNGETVRLTQGVDGNNYPSVEIGENGNWIIAGVDTGKRAQAQDGIAAPYTPKFKIEGDTWRVSYDGGENWTDLQISALPGEDVVVKPNPVTSVEPEGNTLKITLNNGNSYNIPIIENLKCQITDPNSSELLYIPYGGNKTLQVDVELKEGDIVRPVVPADWKAEIVTENYNTAGVKTLEVEVTAPNTASKCIVTIEVNRGINTITDEIVVRTETSSYYDDYMAGFDIEIGGLIINKKTYPDATLHETAGSLPLSGLVFVKDVSELTLEGGVNNLILLPEKPDEMPEIGTSRITINGNFACYGLKLDGSKYTNYLILNSTNTIEYFIFDSCYLIPPTGYAFAYCSKLQIVDKLFFTNNFVYYTKPGNILNCSGMTVKNADFSNNIIASDGAAATGQILSLSTASGDDNMVDLKFTNNTFYNYFSTSQGIIGKLSGETKINYNIFYNNISKSSAFLIKDFMDPSAIKGCYENNVSYNEDAEKKVTWKYFNKDSKKPEGATDEDLIPTATEKPISIPADISTGDFKSIGAYANYGAQR